jgi:hypothetical protein
MAYLSAFDGLPGVRKAVVSDNDGSVLEALGGMNSESENAAGLAAVIARQLGGVGLMLRLGMCFSIVVRSRESARAFVPRQEVLGLLELDPGRMAPDLEARLRSTDFAPQERSRPAVRPPPVPLTHRRAAPGTAPEVANPSGGGQRGREGSVVRTWSNSLPSIQPDSPVDLGEPPTTSSSEPAGEAPAQEVEASSPAAVSAGVVAKRTPAFGSRTTAEDHAMFSGNLQMICLTDLLEFFRNGRRTGTLMCSCEEGSGRVRLREGMIVDALSPHNDGHGLLKRLVESGAASEEQLGALAPGIGTDLDNIHVVQRLIEAGFTDPEVVRSAMQKHVQGAIDELVRWSNGKFSFHPGAVSPEIPPAVVEFDPHIILLQIFKEQDEAER